MKQAYQVLIASFIFISCLLITLIIYIPNKHIDGVGVFEVRKGLFASEIYDELKEEGYINSKQGLSLFSDLTGTTLKLKAGYYIFPKHASIATINRYLANGIHPYETITIIPGMNEDDVNVLIKEAPYLKKTYLKQSDIGLLYADTYFYEYGMDSKVIINKAKDKLTKVIDEIWQERDRSLPIRNKYDYLKVASIVVEEASDEDQYINVAAVIYKRLKIRMQLAVDPTLNYYLKKSTLTKKDLKLKTRYNTRIYYGLPPTPIAFVNRTVLDACKHFKDTPYLYFIGVNKKMYYATDFKGHQKNIDAYLD
tara:strand:- start:431 stop:1357 length:927 start_codon:yes stop_codon:yes gene_type:complete